ncbi:peptidyl-prolyl cis-trans isomerase [Acrasis kona]|uniref:peptidylprolyl isomerase n=1 Tax=Acrasis kona TaxID=1008807 RepID=A0AAW2ZFL4_9EUKA
MSEVVSPENGTDIGEQLKTSQEEQVNVGEEVQNTAEQVENNNTEPKPEPQPEPEPQQDEVQEDKPEQEDSAEAKSVSEKGPFVGNGNFESKKLKNLKLLELVHFPNVFLHVMRFLGSRQLVACHNVSTKWRSFVEEKKLFEAECSRLWPQCADVGRYNGLWKSMLLDENSQNINYPHVYFDLSVNKEHVGRLLIKLDKHTTPKTAENFRALCTGEMGICPRTNKPLYYKGSKIHRIIPGLLIQGGDIVEGNGIGSVSIYDGKPFEDENFTLKHGIGTLSMAGVDNEPDTNGCQFFISTSKAQDYNGKHVVFGKVIEGMDVIKKLDIHGNSIGEIVTADVVVEDCGQLGYSSKPVVEAKETKEYVEEPKEVKEEVPKDQKKAEKSSVCNIL